MKTPKIALTLDTVRSCMPAVHSVHPGQNMAPR
jgi:hypothetical protein